MRHQRASGASYPKQPLMSRTSSMKCPKCGARNGETNKFCRECGCQLENLANQQGQLDADLPDDELALGEELFDVMQLYSAGELDKALEKIERVIEAHPDSASAHNIVALVFERNAEKAPDKEAAKKLLRQAIAHYETIIEMNPDSGADREKLASLKLQLTGEPPSAPVPTSVKPLDLEAAFRSIPKPALVAGVVFLIVLMVAIIVFPSPKREPVRAAARPETIGSGRAVGSEVTSAPTPQPLRVYTFPAPAASGPRTPSPENNLPGVQPLKLPPLGSVSIVPVGKENPKDTKKGASAQPKQGDAKAEAKAKPPPAGPDGASMLALAIEQHNEGRTADAIASAMEAAHLFQSDIDAGKNATSARRGLENARKMIQIWREAEAPSEEQ